MPIPEPESDEEEEEFMERCMENDIIQMEFKNNEQRVAVCNSLWETEKD